MSADAQTPDSELPAVDDVTFPDHVYAEIEAAADVDSGVLTADDVAGEHTYLADARPDWRGSMASIQNVGGPWPCEGCDGASLLPSRCSKCGRDLTGDTTTQGRHDG